MFKVEELAKSLELVRARAPLVHNITNFVVMNFTANALLAVGASPVMAHALEEVEDMVDLAGALVLNMGTLDGPWVASMLRAARRAKVKKVPVVFDPVGAGATPFRSRVAAQLVEEGLVNVIRGNGSEIMALHQAGGRTKGVDSTESSSRALDSASFLSERWGCTVCVSGAQDFVVTRGQVTMIENGVPLMTKVTGMGCTATALIGAFAAVEPSLHKATIAAMGVMGVAGEMAASACPLPGSFVAAFLDSLYVLQADAFQAKLRARSL